MTLLPKAKPSAVDVVIRGGHLTTLLDDRLMLVQTDSQKITTYLD